MPFSTPQDFDGRYDPITTQLGDWHSFQVYTIPSTPLFSQIDYFVSVLFHSPYGLYGLSRMLTKQEILPGDITRFYMAEIASSIEAVHKLAFGSSNNWKMAVSGHWL